MVGFTSLVIRVGQLASSVEVDVGHCRQVSVADVEEEAAENHHRDDQEHGD